MADMKGAVKWIYQGRRVATQANAGGGAIKVDLSIAAGQVAKLINAFMVNSGTNGITTFKRDEDNNSYSYLAVVGSGAATASYLPSIGTAANASGNVINSHGLLLGPGAKLSFEQSGAGAQNDTYTIHVELELYNLPTEPTWSKARSTNEADVAIAASTISAANTIQPVIY